MSTYHNTPAFEELKTHIERGVVVTGFEKDYETHLVFNNYPDASIAARLVSGCGEESGRVYQTLHHRETGAQMGSHIRIKKDERPRAIPSDQFSLYYVPITMTEKVAKRQFPHMQAQGKMTHFMGAQVKDIVFALRDGPVRGV